MKYLVKNTGLNNNLILNEKTEQKLISLISKQKELEEKMKEIKDNLLQELINNDIKSIKTDNLTITVKEGYDRETFDTKRLKQEDENLYNKYVKFTKVKESIVIKCNDTK